MTGLALTLRRLDEPPVRALLRERAEFHHQTPEWMGVLTAGLGGESLVICLSRGDRIEVGLPSILLRAGPFRLLYAGIPYGDPVGDPTLADELLRTIRAKRSAIPADQFRYVPFGDDGVPAGVFDRAEERTVVHLSLRSFAGPDAFRASLPASVRSTVSRARRAGVVARREDTGDAADAFGALFEQTMRRNRAAVRYGPAYFRALPEGGGALHLARREGRPIAGLVATRRGGVLHYLHAASDAEALRCGANDLLLDDLLVAAFQEGIHTVDLGACDPRDAGLISFKTKWGGCRRPAFVHVAHLRPLRSRLSDAAKRILLRPGFRPPSGSPRGGSR